MRTFLSIAIGLFLFTGLASVYAQSGLRDQLTVGFSNPGQPGKLELELVYGSIHVTGYAGREVILEATSAGETASPSPDPHNEGMKRMSRGNPLGLSADEENNQIKVSTRSAFLPIQLTVKVPYKTALKLRTFDKGDILVEQVAGDLEVDNVKGAISLTNIGGSVVASTYDGRLSASFQAFTPRKPMAFSSMSGRIELSLPASLKATLKVKSQQGEVFSDFDLVRNPTKTIHTTDAGRTHSTLDDWLYAPLNGGGPELMIKNYLGNIYVKQSK